MQNISTRPWTTDHSRRFRQLFSELRKQATSQKCHYCGREGTLCKSHFAPKSFLKNISLNGKVDTFFALYPQGTFPESDGISKAGTFKMICRDCDNKIFRTYENPDNLKQLPTQKMMAEIAMKNYLKFLKKRHVEILHHDSLVRRHPENAFTILSSREQKIFDAERYEKCFNKAKRISLGKSGGKYHVIYYNHLKYVVPLAFQAALTIIYDLSGNVLNDVLSRDTSQKYWELHVCIFPLKESSVILLFIDDNGKKIYGNFITEFEKLQDNDKLALISYLIFLYSEDMYIYPPVTEKIRESPVLMTAARDGDNPLIMTVEGDTQHYHDIPYSALSDAIRKTHDLNNYRYAPNLLSYAFRVKKEEKIK